MDPIEQLQIDRAAARDLQDPCASLCTLANVDEHGLPQARTLVLRDVDDRLAVFVNASSPKWPHLERGPVSLVVWLPSLQVQYRLACATAPVPAETVASSWQLRPDPPKRMDWFYTLRQPQGSEVADRQALLDALAALELPEPLVAPAGAMGLFLLPERIERLDLRQANGVHDRRLFVRGNPTWKERVLAP